MRKRKHTILCLDDEKSILISLRSQLIRNFGTQFRYEFAESGEEALELVDEVCEYGSEILVIVSDWQMPEMKGDEFLIRVHQKHPNIIKIMLTGQVRISAIERAKSEANLFLCLDKPWKENEFIEAIQNGIKLRLAS